MMVEMKILWIFLKQIIIFQQKFICSQKRYQIVDLGLTPVWVPKSVIPPRGVRLWSLVFVLLFCLSIAISKRVRKKSGVFWCPRPPFPADRFSPCCLDAYLIKVTTISRTHLRQLWFILPQLSSIHPFEVAVRCGRCLVLLLNEIQLLSIIHVSNANKDNLTIITSSCLQRSTDAYSGNHWLHHCPISLNISDF